MWPEKKVFCHLKNDFRAEKWDSLGIKSNVKQIIKAKRNTANTRHTESLLYTTWSDKASRHTHTLPKWKEIKETSLEVRWLPRVPAARASSAAPKAHKARSKKLQRQQQQARSASTKSSKLIRWQLQHGPAVAARAPVHFDSYLFSCRVHDPGPWV